MASPGWTTSPARPPRQSGAARSYQGRREGVHLRRREESRHAAGARRPADDVSCRIIPACAGDTESSLIAQLSVTDHPRVCGAQYTEVPAAEVAGGSSPRVRGDRGCPSAGASLDLDHPRVRGGHVSCRCISCRIPGSSPRVRGKLWLPQQNHQRRRIISACAGDTSCRYRQHRWPTDHPRGCGGHGPLPALAVQVSGSSPRVRGTHLPEPGAQSSARIIPACAGNTSRSSLTGSVIADYSPRVRRTRSRTPPKLFPKRIIPACAGDTCLRIECHGVSPDHPRVCGGHRIMALGLDLSRGSSPRVWGTRSVIRASARSVRIIPACAGDTSVRSDGARPHPDHPHVCGGHFMPAMTSSRICGSSPRVRGTPDRSGAADACRRIIPACAGDTRAPSGC